MTQFCSSKRLCCWAGLTPGSNETGGKKKSVRIMRSRVYLKPALVQCAHAVKSDKSIYQMLSTGEAWNPTNLYKTDIPEALVEKQKAKVSKQAMKFLQKEGIMPLDEPLASRLKQFLI